MFSKIAQSKIVSISKKIFKLVCCWKNCKESEIYCTYNNSGQIFEQIVTVVYLHVILFRVYEIDIAGEQFWTNSKIYDGGFFARRANKFWFLTIFAKKTLSQIFGMALSMPLSYRDSVWYCNTYNTRAISSSEIQAHY